jgi:hypothetical protein
MFDVSRQNTWLKWSVAVYPVSPLRCYSIAEESACDPLFPFSLADTASPKPISQNSRSLSADEPMFTTPV